MYQSQMLGSALGWDLNVTMHRDCFLLTGVFSCCLYAAHNGILHTLSCSVAYARDTQPIAFTSDMYDWKTLLAGSLLYLV